MLLHRGTGFRLSDSHHYLSEHPQISVRGQLQANIYFKLEYESLHLFLRSTEALNISNNQAENH